MSPNNAPPRSSNYQGRVRDNQQQRPLTPLLPTKFLLTVEAVLYIALQSPDRPIKLIEAIPAKSFSARHLEATFQYLVRMGILQSIKGSKGGYTLGRPSEAISLIDLYNASAIRSAKQFDVAEGPTHQTVSSLLEYLQSRWAADLAQVSIRDLVNHLQTL
jgi:Rrf2 family protein